MLFIKLDACKSGPYDGVIVVVVGGCVASGNNVPSCVCVRKSWIMEIEMYKNYNSIQFKSGNSITEFWTEEEEKCCNLEY